MHRSRFALTFACSLTLVGTLASPAAARHLPEWFRQVEHGPTDVLVNDVDGGVRPMRRCGTPVLPEADRQRIEEAAELSRLLLPEGEERKRTIPVAFHVIHKGAAGNLTDQEVMAQIDTLDRAYKKFGADFQLVALDRKGKGSWFKKCQKDGPFNKMTRKLAVDPTHVLNIYTCRPGDNLLGFAIPPGVIPESHPWNAVVIHYGSLPNGPLFPYDEGDTLVHEVGHYFSLLHTFENGCSAPGDEVADTPFEASPAFGCPIGRDTCSQSGVDPIHNFMDYSDDACLDTFSKKQRARMNQLLPILRPGLGN
ncbi:MAG: zinc metalloprotease [Thermoanaerobaculia bacterium]